MRWNLLLPILILSASALAQEADDSKPAISNLMNARHPRVYPDGSVAFRLVATNATKVQLAGAVTDKPVDMKGEGGAWTVTIPAPPVGFHYYWFMVDGLQVNDPGSDTYFGYGRPTSGIELLNRARTFTSRKMCRTARCACSGISPGPPARGGVQWFTRRLATMRTLKLAIQCSIFNTAPVRMKPGGPGRAMPISFWITSWPGKSPSQ